MCKKYFAFGALFTALIKAELRRVFTVKLEINTIFTPKETHSLTILMILLTKRSLLTSELLMSLEYKKQQHWETVGVFLLLLLLLVRVEQ